MCGFLLMKPLLAWKAAHRHSTRSPWTWVSGSSRRARRGTVLRLWGRVVGPAPHRPQRTISAQECLALMIAGFLTLDPGVSDKAASGGRVRLPHPPHQRNDASGATGRPGTQGRDSRSRCYCVPEAKVEKNGLSQRPGEELRKQT